MIDQNLYQEESTFASRQKGTNIYYRTLRNFENTKDEHIHLVFLHGLVEHSGRHQDFFNYFLINIKEPAVVSSMDIIGHGKSRGPRTYVEKFSHFEDDLVSFLNLLQEKFPKGNYFVMGHSLGGLIVTKTLINHHMQIKASIQAMILTNPCIRQKIEVPKIFRNFIEQFSKKLAMTRLPSLYDGFSLTKDRQKALDFNNDPLISTFITVKLANEILKENSNIVSLSYYQKLPLLVILSGEDELTNNEMTKLFLTAVAKELIQVQEYPDAKHDILNDLERIDVYNNVISYIKSQRNLK